MGDPSARVFEVFLIVLDGAQGVSNSQSVLVYLFRGRLPDVPAPLDDGDFLPAC